METVKPNSKSPHLVTDLEMAAKDGSLFQYLNFS